MIKNIRTFFLILLFFNSIWSAESQQLLGDQKSKGVAIDSTVRYGKLDNGFTYYLRKNNSPASTIELHMIVKAGIYHEDNDQSNYAHLLEHVGASSTKHFQRLKDFFRTSGRYSHATTSTDYTQYYTRVSSEDKDVLTAGLQLLRDWAQDIRLEQELIDVQRGAVLGETRTIDPHQKWLFDTIERQVLRNTGFRLIDRKKRKSSIQNFNREAFFRYYKDWYRPDLEAAIIVGDIDVDSVELEIKRLFSDLKMPDIIKDAQERVDSQTIKLSGENQYLTVLDTLKPDFRMYMISKSRNHEFETRTQTDYKDMLLQKIYRAMIANKSEQLEQQYDVPFSEFSANYRANQMGGGQISAASMTVDFKTDDPQHMKKRFIKALIAWKRMHLGFTDSELEKAKDQILQNHSSGFTTSSSQFVERYLKHYVRDIPAPKPEEELTFISQLLDQIDLSEIQSFALDYADLTINKDFLFFTGDKNVILDHRMFRKWVEEVDSMKVKPLPPQKPPIASLTDVAQIPLKGKTEADVITENTIGVTTILLENGIKLLLKPTTPSSDRYVKSVSIDAYRTNEVPKKNREKYLTARIAPEVVKFSGAGPYSKFELKRYMQDKGLRLKFELDKDVQRITAESKEGDVEELLNLLYLYSDKPRRDSEGFTAWKAHKMRQLKGVAAKGSSEFYMEDIQALWFPEVPRLRMEDLNQLKMEEVSKAYEQWYSDFGNYTFIVSGDFDKNYLIPVLVKNLSAFPVGDLGTPDTVPKYSFPLMEMDETIKLNNIDQAFVRLYFPITASREVKTQIELRLLSEALADKTYESLRAAGCYAPRAGGDWLDIKNGVYAFWIAFDSELSKEDKLIQVAIEEFRNLRKDGIDQAWLEKEINDGKTAYGNYLDRFWLLNFWPDYLQEKLVHGEDIQQEVLQYKTILEHFISLEDMNAAAETYLTEENLQQFVVVPEQYEKENNVR